VLITGASGTLAAHVARHLVTAHGVKELWLCSRRGLEGCEVLCDELTALGATVHAAAVDVASRPQLQALLAQIDSTRPLGIIHTAGTTADALLESQTADKLSRVFGPKVQGAWLLHELTADRALSAFVLFSSVAGVLGAAGQSNYAAANSFLDALAQLRRAQGKPATSLAWGLWAEKSALSAHLRASDLERMARAGMRPLASERGLELLALALRRIEPNWVPLGLDPRKLSASDQPLASLLRGFAGARTPQAEAQQSSTRAFSLRFERLAPQARSPFVLESVKVAVAEVMRVDPSAIADDAPLKDLGLDSLMAVELRNQLSRSTGLRLPATLLFDHPTSAALARSLCAQLEPEPQDAASVVLAELNRIDQRLTSLQLSDDAHAALMQRLAAFTHKWSATRENGNGIEAAVSGADDDALYAMIDRSLAQ
jgi:NAD(P)-dependent dehydrogenase (short-subunit alcohol dehydrogenase family)/acyl carrier protein